MLVKKKNQNKIKNNFKNNNNKFKPNNNFKFKKNNKSKYNKHLLFDRNDINSLFRHFKNFHKYDKLVKRPEFVLLNLPLTKYRYRVKSIFNKGYNYWVFKNYKKFSAIPWYISRRFLAQLTKDNVRRRLVNSHFYNTYIYNNCIKFNYERSNQFLNNYWEGFKNWYKVWNYDSRYLRYDYYIEKKKKLATEALPHLIRFSRYNKYKLYNYKNNNLVNNKIINKKLPTILALKKFNYIESYLYNTKENVTNIYGSNFLYYFWIWKLITFNNTNKGKNNININLNNNFLNVNKFLFDNENYFFNKVFLTTYKRYYLELLRNKRNINFKVNKRLTNKLFAKKLFWKYYKNIFFKKRRFKKAWNNVGYPYTLKNIGVVTIFISLNNTFVTLTDLNGNVLYNAWAGILGIKGPKRSTPTASEAVAKKVGIVAREKGMKYIYIKLNGVLYTRKMKSAIKGFVSSTKLKVLRVLNVTPKPHNGIRKKKIKKV